MNKTLLIVGGLLVISVLGFVSYSANMEMKQKTAMEAESKMMAEKEAMMKKDGESMESGEAMMKKDGESMESGEAMMKKDVGMYTQYSAEKLALAKENKVVIFFAASWCPSCRALDSEINAAGVKSGVVILKADYDTEKVLKAKYAVTSQHTLVQVDATGNQIAKWSGGGLANIYTKIK